MCGVQIHNTPNKYTLQRPNDLMSLIVVVFQLRSACRESYSRITRGSMLRSRDELNTRSLSVSTKFQKKLYHFNRNSQLRSVMWKMIQLDIQSRTKKSDSDSHSTHKPPTPYDSGSYSAPLVWRLSPGVPTSLAKKWFFTAI